MLEFNVGELVTRLRTSLGVRGRMPLGLDEVVIPTTLVEEVNRAPFRVQPIEFHGYWQVQTAAGLAGRGARVACYLPNTPPGVVAVIRRYRVQVSSFVSASGALDPALQGWTLFFWNGPETRVAATVACQTSERYAAGFNATNCDVNMGDNNNGVSPVPVATTVAIDGGYCAPGGFAPWVDCNIPLYGTLGIMASSVDSSATGQARLALSVQGDLYTGFTFPS